MGGRGEGGRKKTKKQTEGTTKGVRAAAFLSGKDLFLASPMTSPKLMTEEQPFSKTQGNKLSTNLQMKSMYSPKGLHRLERDAGATKTKKDRKVLLCKENHS